MKFLTKNPFDYNTIANKRKDEEVVKYTPQASELAMNQDFVLVSKFLGIEEKADFNKYCDKIHDIIVWAKERCGSNSVRDIVNCLKERINAIPQLNNSIVSDLWISIKLDQVKENEDNS